MRYFTNRHTLEARTAALDSFASPDCHAPTLLRACPARASGELNVTACDGFGSPFFQKYYRNRYGNPGSHPLIVCEGSARRGLAFTLDEAANPMALALASASSNARLDQTGLETVRVAHPGSSESISRFRHCPAPDRAGQRQQPNRMIILDIYHTIVFRWLGVA